MTKKQFEDFRIRQQNKSLGIGDKKIRDLRFDIGFDKMYYNEFSFDQLKTNDPRLRCIEVRAEYGMFEAIYECWTTEGPFRIATRAPSVAECEQAAIQSLNSWGIWTEETKVENWTTEGEVEMGFTKNSKNVEFDKANMNDLARFQKMAIAWFISPQVHRRIESYKTESERTAALAAVCADPMHKARAKIAYDTIVRGLGAPEAKAQDASVEQRFLEMCAQFLAGKDEEFGAKFKRSLDAFKADDLPALAKKALTEAAQNYRPIVIEQEGKKKKVMKGVLPAEFERMVKLASARVPIMLVGPAGCGKTYLCEKLAEALDMEYSDQSCSEGMSESVFNGLLLPIGKGGEFKHVTSPFIDRYEMGGVMLLDEMDAGDPNLFTYINKAIANSSYTVMQRFEKPVVRKHKDFVLVAAANTFGHGADAMYVGRNQLDAATLDRFKVGLITMDYSKEVEQSLADEKLLNWAWNIREKIRTHKLRRVMSTRVIKDLSKMTSMYAWDKAEWEASYFTGWTAEDRKMVLA